MSTPSSTPTAAADRNSRPTRITRLAILAGVLAAAALLLAASSGLGSRLGWWHFSTGFTLLRWGAYLGVGAAAAAAAGVIRALAAPHRTGALLSLAALLAGLAVVLVPWQWSQVARAAPPIHDISTDLREPPPFEAVVPLRANAANPPEHPGEETADIQRRSYPHIVPLIVERPPEEVFAAALEAVRSFGWELVEADEETGRIEATARTFWFGFDDDVVVRIRPVEGGARVDVRSKSRIGRGDAGTNARRIEEYLDALRAEFRE